MEQNNTIDLSSIQATSYWWVNVIKSKVRELVKDGTVDKKEIKFAQKFYNYTDKDWRNLYLELVNYITDDVINYKKVIDDDIFSQDTEEKGHDRINEELSKIMHTSIPDIRLASSSSKDSIIYTSMTNSSILYKSCGVTDLPTKYFTTYILTGNEEELDFYNYLLSTIAVLKEKNTSFHSVSLLRDTFCEEYKKINKLQEDSKELLERFNQAFSNASDKGIILGNHYKDTYFCHFSDIDYIGLEQYMEMAEYYSDVILQRSKTTKQINEVELIQNFEEQVPVLTKKRENK